MADSFIRLTLRDGSTHTVVSEADPAALVDAAAKGQRWATKAAGSKSRAAAP